MYMSTGLDHLRLPKLPENTLESSPAWAGGHFSSLPDCRLRLKHLGWVRKAASLQGFRSGLTGNVGSLKPCFGGTCNLGQHRQQY